jgi:hypothetical protein
MSKMSKHESAIVGDIWNKGLCWTELINYAILIFPSIYVKFKIKVTEF